MVYQFEGRKARFGSPKYPSPQAPDWPAIHQQNKPAQPTGFRHNLRQYSKLRQPLNPTHPTDDGRSLCRLAAEGREVRLAGSEVRCHYDEASFFVATMRRTTVATKPASERFTRVSRNFFLIPLSLFSYGQILPRTRPPRGAGPCLKREFIGKFWHEA